MGATIQKDNNGIWVVRISGALRKEEMDAVEATGIRGINSHESERVLILIDENFSGWVEDDAWDDVSFFVEYGDRIEKIGIVGDAKWKTGMLMFTSAGFRRAPVKYFTLDRLDEAQDWMLCAPEYNQCDSGSGEF